MEELAGEVQRLRARVEATEAVLAIHELKAHYADLVDRRWVKGAFAEDEYVAVLAADIAATFTEDGVWDGGPVLGTAYGRAEIAERMRTSTLTFARHFFVKPRIHVDGDRATGRWDILSPCTTGDGTPHWMCGYEDDEYVRHADGRWLHHRMRLTTVFMAPATEGWRRIFT
jgi:SnoaL-like protein